MCMTLTFLRDKGGMGGGGSTSMTDLRLKRLLSKLRANRH